ncbi:histidine phosphatase family protein [Seohaeicola nanhaiensis]|uniref:Histidine phosphatase family protein n=1 Tax=Seohaeicola nanhaiensis TaxID=1387282 RepID=A0ABV9KPS5_9RHOB
MTREYHQKKYAPPDGAADLLLIRHGRTEAARHDYRFPLVDGHGDPALHPEGEEQAVRVGERLRHEPLAAIYVTTLRRTHQTAAPLAAHLGLTPIVEADLREVRLGDWDDGMYRIKSDEGAPEIKRALAEQEWGHIPNGETTAALHERVRRGLLNIAARHADQRVAVVVHGGVIGAAMAIASGAQAFHFNGAENGSITRIVIRGETMWAKSFNDCAHLV